MDYVFRDRSRRASGVFARLIETFCALTALGVLVSAPPVVARDRQLFELPTRDFTIYSSMGERQTRYFATNMLAFDRIVTGMSGSAQRRNAGPTRVFLVSQADWRDYLQLNETTAAFFSDSSGIGNDLVIPVSGDLMQSYQSIFHEYSHFIVRTQFPGYCPPWFNEGLAELLSTAQFRDDRIVLTPARDRLYVLAEGPWIPADVLFGVTQKSREYRSHRLGPSFYAQSWLVMNYAFVVNPEFLRQAVEYVLRLNRGETPDDAAKAAFKRGYDEIDRELRRYASGRAFRNGEILNAGPRAFASTPLRAMGKAESARMLAELGLRVQIPAKRYEPLLAAATQGDPRDVRAMAAQANVWSLNDNRPAAEQLLTQIAALPESTDPEALVLIADTHTVLAVTQAARDESKGKASDELLSQLKPADVDAPRFRLARGLYEKALRIEPGNLAAADGFSRTCTQLRECLDETIAVLTRAQSSAPASWLLAYDLALVHDLKGPSAERLQQWQLVARLAQSPGLRDHALAQVEAAAKPSTDP